MESSPNPEAPSPHTLSNALKRLVFLVAVLSPWGLFCLLGSRQIMFAPPHASYTLVMYGALLIGGAILVLWAVMRSQKGSRTDGCYTLIGYGFIGLVILIVLLALFGPNLGTAIGISSVDCSSEALPDGQIRYTCVVPSFLFSTTYVLEGQAGSPFVQVVSTTFSDG